MISSLYNLVADILSPACCLYCSQLIEERTVLCTSCMNTIVPIMSSTIAITATQAMPVHCVAAYQEPLKTLIVAKHIRNRVVSKQLGYLLWHKSLIHELSYDLIVPIPLHWFRYASRGYNQADLIARYIARMSGKPVMYPLIRSKSTRFQYGLSSQERERNVNDAFSLSSRLIKADYYNKHILLVDDLMTTGSTLRQAARMLLPLKPASITASVICRVV